MKHVFCFLLFVAALSPLQNAQANLFAKIPTMLKIVPPEKVSIRSALNSAMKQRTSRLESLQSSCDKEYLTKKYVYLGLEKMAQDQVQIQLKKHRISERKEDWVSDVSKQLLATKSNEQMRCPGCIGECPRGISCYVIPASMNIRKMLSVIPENEVPLRTDLNAVLNKYKAHARGLSSSDSRESQTMASTYVKIGIDSEIAEETEELLRKELSKKEEPWQEEALYVLNDENE